MYGQNLGGRPDAPGEPIFTKFYLRVRVPDVFLSFEFQKDRVRNVGAVGGRNFASPIDKAHRLYNSLLLPHKPWCGINAITSWGNTGLLTPKPSSTSAIPTDTFVYLKQHVTNTSPMSV